MPDIWTFIIPPAIVFVLVWALNANPPAMRLKRGVKVPQRSAADEKSTEK